MPATPPQPPRHPPFGRRTSARPRFPAGGAAGRPLPESTAFTGWNTLRGVTSVWIKDFQATVGNDRAKNHRVTAEVSFVMERR